MAGDEDNRLANRAFLAAAGTAFVLSLCWLLQAGPGSAAPGPASAMPAGEPATRHPSNPDQLELTAPPQLAGP